TRVERPLSRMRAPILSASSMRPPGLVSETLAFWAAAAAASNFSKSPASTWPERLISDPSFDRRISIARQTAGAKVEVSPAKKIATETSLRKPSLPIGQFNTKVGQMGKPGLLYSGERSAICLGSLLFFGRPERMALDRKKMAGLQE